MTAYELMGALVTPEATITIVVILTGLLWILRRSGVAQEITTNQEIAAALSAALIVLGAALYSGKTSEEALIYGALIVIGTAKWNSPELGIGSKR